MCDYNFGAVDVVSFVVAAISLVETTKDIYSWGVCEYGSEGGRRLSPWGGQSRVSCTVFGDLLRF